MQHEPHHFTGHMLVRQKAVSETRYTVAWGSLLTKTDSEILRFPRTVELKGGKPFLR